MGLLHVWCSGGPPHNSGRHKHQRHDSNLEDLGERLSEGERLRVVELGDGSLVDTLLMLLQVGG